MMDKQAELEPQELVVDKVEQVQRVPREKQGRLVEQDQGA
jgi:hypothetical protein